MAQGQWAPDDVHYELIEGVHKGIVWVRQAWEAAGLEFGQDIVTSRDEKVQRAQEILKATSPNVPEGMAKWQLPGNCSPPSRAEPGKVSHAS